MQLEMDKQLTQLAKTIIDQMKVGAEHWFMPWHSGLQEPYNPVTVHIFKGRNAVILWQACIARGYKRFIAVFNQSWIRLKKFKTMPLNGCGFTIMNGHIKPMAENHH